MELVMMQLVLFKIALFNFLVQLFDLRILHYRFILSLKFICLMQRQLYMAGLFQATLLLITMQE